MPLIEARGLTLVGISVGNLDDDSAVQLALPFDRRRADALDAALDDVRDRFGSSGGHPGRAARPRPGPDDAAAARLTDAALVGWLVSDTRRSVRFRSALGQGV